MRFISLLLAMLIIVVTVYITIDTGDVINIKTKDMHKTHHTFHLYETGWDAFWDKNEIDSLQIPLGTNGNYVGDPTTKTFELWLSAVKNNREAFNLDVYNLIISRHW